MKFHSQYGGIGKGLSGKGIRSCRYCPYEGIEDFLKRLIQLFGYEISSLKSELDLMELDGLM